MNDTRDTRAEHAAELSRLERELDAARTAYLEARAAAAASNDPELHAASQRAYLAVARARVARDEFAF